MKMKHIVTAFCIYASISHDGQASFQMQRLNLSNAKYIECIYIPDQFTVKAYPALLRGGGGWGEPNNEALLFQSTIDIVHFKNAHKTLFQSTVDIHFETRRKQTKNCEDLHSVRLLVNAQLHCNEVHNSNVLSRITFVENEDTEHKLKSWDNAWWALVEEKLELEVEMTKLV